MSDSSITLPGRPRSSREEEITVNTQPGYSFVPITLGILLSGIGCGGEAPPEGDTAPTETHAEPLWFATGAKRWPVTGTFGLTSIKVCFDASHPFADDIKARIRTLVEENWERSAFIDFWGWQNCTGSLTNSIRVGFYPTLSSSEGGEASVGWVQGGTNDVKFRLANPETHTILHEFGHSLGFQHEYQSLNPCVARTSGAESLEGEHDGLSVMNTPCVGTPTRISGWDILGIQRKYGAKPPGSVVGIGGHCLNIWGNTTAINTPILSAACSGQPNDKFFRDDGALTLKAQLSTAQRCADVQGGVISTGFTPLVSNFCNPPALDEQFSFTGVDWRAMGDKCVVPVSNAAGSHLILGFCGTNAWDFFPGSSKIRLTGTNLCVNTTAGLSAPPIGTEPVLMTCRPDPNVFESFFFNSGRIYLNYEFLDLCFNVFGGTATNGNHIGIWDGCFANPPIPNSVFSIKGRIQSMGQCVDMFSGVAGDALPIGVFPCHTGENQKWDYYW
jgi:hypothetical protein